MFTLIQLRSVQVPPSLIYALATPNDNRLYEGNIQYPCSTCPITCISLEWVALWQGLISPNTQLVVGQQRAEAAQEELTQSSHSLFVQCWAIGSLCLEAEISLLVNW